MATWTDNTGRDWTVLINVNAVKRAKELAGVDVLDVFDGKLFADVLTNPLVLVETFYAICSPQAGARNLTYEQFADILTGDSLESAATALVQGVIDFFPRGRREVLRRLWEKTMKAETAAVTLATTKMDSPTMEAAIAKAMMEAEAVIDRQLSEFGNASTNVQASPDWTPDR